MKIYFCDGCNESIPLADIQAGQVTTIKGKLFCRNCIPPGVGGAGGAPAPAARQGTHPLVATLLLLLIAWAVWRELPRLTGEAPRDDGAVSEAPEGGEPRLVKLLQDDVARLRASFDEVERGLASLRGDLDASRGVAADLQRGADQLRQSVDALERSQAGTGQLIEKLQLQEARTQTLESRIDTLADMLNGQQELLDAGLADRPGPVAAAQPGPAQPAIDPGQQAAIDALRRALLDAAPGNRFDAVDKVLKGRFKQLAADLMPMLKDEDSFVRMHVMRTLGDFGYTEAVPSLFEVIDDPNPVLRDVAAEQLVRLTGYDPGYDARAGKPERDKVVRRWRDWVGSH